MQWIIHTYSARYAELNRISENVLRYYPAQPVEHILSSGPESDMFSACTAFIRVKLDVIYRQKKTATEFKSDIIRGCVCLRSFQLIPITAVLKN